MAGRSILGRSRPDNERESITAYGAPASLQNVPARSADRTIADPLTGIGGGRSCPFPDFVPAQSVGRRRVEIDVRCFETGNRVSANAIIEMTNFKGLVTEEAFLPQVVAHCVLQEPRRTAFPIAG